jgi:hypothetical protein
MVLPIPLLAPVTMAVLPIRSNILSFIEKLLVNNTLEVCSYKADIPVSI